MKARQKVKNDRNQTFPETVYMTETGYVDSKNREGKQTMKKTTTTTPAKAGMDLH